MNAIPCPLGTNLVPGHDFRRFVSRSCPHLVLLIVSMVCSLLEMSVARGQENSLLQEVEKKVQELLRDHADAADTAQNTANPLLRRRPDPAALNRAIKVELDRLIGQAIALDTVVGGFQEDGNRVLVALVREDALEQPFLTTSLLRYRCQGDAALLVMGYEAPGKFAREDYDISSLAELEAYQQRAIKAGLFPVLQQLSPISVMGEVGLHIEKEVVEKFDLGSKFRCRLQIKSYALSWEQEKDPDMNAMLEMGLLVWEQQDPEWATVRQLMKEPYIEIHCEWHLEASSDDLTEKIRANPNAIQPYLERARIRHTRGEYRESISDCAHAIALNQSSAEAWMIQGQNHVQLKQFEQAIRDLEKVVELEPQNHSAWGLLGKCLLEQPNAERAITCLTKAIELSPLIDYQSLRGDAYLQSRQFSQAIDDYTRALEDEANKARLLCRRGQCHFETGDYATAQSDYFASLRVDNKFTDARFGLAFLYATSPQSYLRNGEKALELISDSIESLELLSPRQLSVAAAVYAELGNYPRAIDLIGIAMERADSDSLLSRDVDYKHQLDLYKNRESFRHQPVAQAPSPEVSPKDPLFFIGNWMIDRAEMEKRKKEILDSLQLPQELRNDQAALDDIFSKLITFNATFYENGTLQWIDKGLTWQIVEHKNPDSFQVSFGPDLSDDMPSSVVLRRLEGDRMEIKDESNQQPLSSLIFRRVK